MVARTIASKSELQRVVSSRLRGFVPIYHKELARWFSNRRWISQLIIWIFLSALPTITLTPIGTTALGTQQGVSLLSLFLWLGTIPMTIGTIVLTQGTIIEEKLTQTLLWIYSKPLSRPAFILGKFAAYAVFIGLIMLGVPAIIIYVAALIYGLPSQVLLLGYIVSVLMIYLVLLFILALTLMLGTLFNHIGTVTAISLFVFIVGVSLHSNQQLQQIEPYSFGALQRYAVETVGGRFPTDAWIAIGSTLLLTVLFLLVASWQMERYEM